MARASTLTQLRELLGLRHWQLERALTLGLIPPMDRSRGWSADLVNELAARAEQIHAGVGFIPDSGATRAAEALTRRFGVEVNPDAVSELGRRGVIPVVGEYKGWPIYCGLALERLHLDPAQLEQAATEGQLLMAAQAAEWLRVRETDFAHLVRVGRIAPARYSRCGHLPKSVAPDVPLYRVGDLTALAADASLDWAAARAAGRGARSPFAALPSIGETS
ncbi:hypothetical protein ACIBG7_43025 [Nonomuraea sp. NPDC050328]|uniref:hypothetical protein n=1 Tax=Nonomuraea sp. NPDC050328 TaxID=3364361 RepID=UPI0037B587A8